MVPVAFGLTARLCVSRSSVRKARSRNGDVGEAGAGRAASSSVATWATNEGRPIHSCTPVMRTSMRPSLRLGARFISDRDGRAYRKSFQDALAKAALHKGFAVRKIKEGQPVVGRARIQAAIQPEIDGVPATG
jgi:hypothetical protein